MKKINLKSFPEKYYKEIISEIGPYRYQLFSKEESLPGNLFSKINGLEDCGYVVAGTGATSANYVISDLRR
ncbi:MAG: hypothetical protein KBD53_10560 [Candidatus Omnitrophica bacterium]|nr:hypothetical protein [Candidatus Omnitrophota bacterium]